MSSGLSVRCSWFKGEAICPFFVSDDAISPGEDQEREDGYRQNPAADRQENIPCPLLCPLSDLLQTLHIHSDTTNHKSDWNDKITGNIADKLKIDLT